MAADVCSAGPPPIPASPLRDGFPLPPTSVPQTSHLETVSKPDFSSVLTSNATPVITVDPLPQRSPLLGDGLLPPPSCPPLSSAPLFHSSAPSRSLRSQFDGSSWTKYFNSPPLENSALSGNDFFFMNVYWLM